jgi:hypothetical protein
MTEDQKLEKLKKDLREINDEFPPRKRTRQEMIDRAQLLDWEIVSED